VDLPEAFAFEAAQSPLQLPLLVADHVRAEVAVGAVAIALLAETLRQVEDDRHRQEVVLARRAGSVQVLPPCSRAGS